MQDKQLSTVFVFLEKMMAQYDMALIAVVVFALFIAVVVAASVILFRLVVVPLFAHNRETRKIDESIAEKNATIATCLADTSRANASTSVLLQEFLRAFPPLVESMRRSVDEINDASQSTVRSNQDSARDVVRAADRLNALTHKLEAISDTYEAAMRRAAHKTRGTGDAIE